MPFARSQFDPGFSTPQTDHTWYDNLFDFSRVPWDVLFLFGLFTAIVGFLIAHWWLAQRMRKYKDRIRIVESERVPFEPIPDPSVEFPPYHSEPDSCFIPSSSSTKKVRFVEEPEIIEPKDHPSEDEETVPVPTHKTPSPKEPETPTSTKGKQEETDTVPTPPRDQENVETKETSSTPESTQPVKDAPKTPKKSKAKPKKSSQSSKENEIDLIDIV